MKTCINQQENLADCPCTYEPCARKGICCECLKYHLASNELPACLQNLSAIGKMEVDELDSPRRGN